MGWDNTTEMVAAVVDALNVLIRLTYNAASTNPQTDAIPRITRPYESDKELEPKGISLTDFTDILRKGEPR
jgi:hypothetical protein